MAGGVAVATSSESSGRALIRGLMSPTTGVAFLRASAACCSLACLMELISKSKKYVEKLKDPTVVYTKIVTISIHNSKNK